MRFGFAAIMIAFGIACATHDTSLIQTEVITYPKGALVQYQGHSLGRAPVTITLPQDHAGHLTEHAEVRAVPNTEQPALYAQNRVFDPSNRLDRVPDRIMIDLNMHASNMIVMPEQVTTHVERDSSSSISAKPKPIDRGKPTQAVGIDRWSPGNY